MSSAALKACGGRGAKGEPPRSVHFRGVHIRSCVKQAYDCHREADGVLSQTGFAALKALPMNYHRFIFLIKEREQI